MKILIFGAGGMLGHKLVQVLSQTHTVLATLRNASNDLPREIAGRSEILCGVDINEIKHVESIIKNVRPDYVINCIGIIKQLPAANNSEVSIFVNSLFPHILARLCAVSGCRMIHISTDCVFSGKTGNYSEESNSDAYDLYGRSKYLGEVNYDHTLTIRTSIIGHELKQRVGLVDWFLSQKKRAKGYSNAIYTGFSTVELASIIRDIILENKTLHGLAQISSEKISKYDLLNVIASVYGKTITIEKDDTVKIDRSLLSDRFRKLTGFKPKPWDQMVKDMFFDYNEFRKFYSTIE